jgi:hypothetical protein
MRQVGSVVLILFPDNLLEQHFKCAALHWQNGADQDLKLR